MIELRDLHKQFNGGQRVLRGVDLTIETGETLAIVGQSGCGKSVLLKHIIGLLVPDAGEVIIDGKNIHQLPERELYDLRRRFGFLFQSAALFDSMTVYENVALGLVENSTLPDDEIRSIVAEKLQMVGLPGIEQKKPAELSGGMRKRVGLARALATNPDYLLYDEPTTGLDPVMSNQIDALIAEITGKLNATSIVVTHDMFSVYTIVHRVAMMHEGRIYFTGTPSEFQSAEDPVIRDFIERFGRS
ncbi:MAG: ABC transporter ATP-binding protein [Bacteroidota bacterium]|jgi:phospholipid/cholesterol/gamma-HCH transport system ATP-binding protein|nr:ABC transporter ATP-binding protein [Bacteroidota bacterium]